MKTNDLIDSTIRAIASHSPAAIRAAASEVGFDPLSDYLFSGQPAPVWFNPRTWEWVEWLIFTQIMGALAFFGVIGCGIAAMLS